MFWILLVTYRINMFVLLFYCIRPNMHNPNIVTWFQLVLQSTASQIILCVSCNSDLYAAAQNIESVLHNLSIARSAIHSELLSHILLFFWQVLASHDNISSRRLWAQFIGFYMKFHASPIPHPWSVFLKLLTTEDHRVLCDVVYKVR